MSPFRGEPSDVVAWQDIWKGWSVARSSVGVSMRQSDRVTVADLGGAFVLGAHELSAGQGSSSRVRLR